MSERDVNLCALCACAGLLSGLFLGMWTNADARRDRVQAEHCTVRCAPLESRVYDGECQCGSWTAASALHK